MEKMAIDRCTHLHLFEAPGVGGILKRHIAVGRFAIAGALSAIEHNGRRCQENGQNAGHNATDGAHGTWVAAGGRGHMMLAEGEPNRICEHAGTCKTSRQIKTSPRTRISFLAIQVTNSP